MNRLIQQQHYYTLYTHIQAYAHLHLPDAPCVSVLSKYDPNGPNERTGHALKALWSLGLPVVPRAYHPLCTAGVRFRCIWLVHRVVCRSQPQLHRVSACRVMCALRTPWEPQSRHNRIFLGTPGENQRPGRESGISRQTWSNGNKKTTIVVARSQESQDSS